MYNRERPVKESYSNVTEQATEQLAREQNSLHKTRHKVLRLIICYYCRYGLIITTSTVCVLLMSVFLCLRLWLLLVGEFLCKL